MLSPAPPGAFARSDRYLSCRPARQGVSSITLKGVVLNTPPERRQRNLDEDLAQLSYINGELFAERLSIPSFNRKMRDLLLDACSFKWDAISPAIFGSLFQSVMDKKKRRSQGAHYTTERNILKVIEPLFLDEIRAELEHIKAHRGSGRRKTLEAFHDKLSKLRFFDPACGAGNFLIITYRELRMLEIELLRALYPGQLSLDVNILSRIDVDQFYGIELGEFACRIAEVALWMMDHLMNNRLSLEFGQSYVRIPLRATPHIRNADALEIDWASVLPPEKCSYVLGNPPFAGSKWQSDAQRAQVQRVAQLGGSGGSLDYVSAWFIRAGAYAQQSPASIGFVATNSITQGEQVAQLWPVLYDRYKLEIIFAHRTFAWGSDARGKAHVHVVIIGLAMRERAPAQRRLFSYATLDGEPTESQHAVLTAYLFDASRLSNPHLVVRERKDPLSPVPKMISGSKPIDDGNFIFNSDERAEFLKLEPAAAPFIRPFIGTDEYVNGVERWILALHTATPAQLRAMPRLMERVVRVKEYRLRSTSAPTRKLAEMATLYHVNVVPTAPFLAVPEVSSERREYIPIGWLEPPIIPSNKLRLIKDADLWHFGVLTSRMHMAWTRLVGGRLKSDFQYSVGINYNAFPWPEVSDEQRDKVRDLARGVLEARALFPGATLADLYDTDVMRPELRRAHRVLDTAVDKLYRSKAFEGDRDRVELLLGLYEAMVVPLAPPPTKVKGSRARV